MRNDKWSSIGVGVVGRIAKSGRETERLGRRFRDRDKRYESLYIFGPVEDDPVRGSCLLAERCPDPSLGDAGTLRRVVGLWGVLPDLCCGTRGLWCSPAALASPASLTPGHRGQRLDHRLVPPDADCGDPFLRAARRRSRGGGGAVAGPSP